ncbi:hypothetical protein [Consotaella aegiceratis]|uniref:hypothetical protein n=1 Tax=Consotaella aegiceratis TaxID=3097961 RepID=UPI002F4291C4
MCYPLLMPEPLSDDEVYELLHAALLLFHGKRAATPLGQDVISTIIRQIGLLQQATIIVREGVSEIPRETE